MKVTVLNQKKNQMKTTPQNTFLCNTSMNSFSEEEPNHSQSNFSIIQLFLLLGCFPAPNIRSESVLL